MSNGDRPLSTTQEQDIRERARHRVAISNEDLWALLDELDLVRKERGRERSSRKAVLRSLEDPQMNTILMDGLLRQGGQRDDLTLHEAARLRGEIDEFLHGRAVAAERRDT